MNCINPIYKLVEYLNTQISSTTTDTQFRDLLTLTLNTTVNGYRIIKRLKQEELKYFNFKKLNFEDVILEKNNLVVANFSIPFCIKNKFNCF